MNPANRNGQRGAVLVIALLFLTILTILGVTAMTSTTYEERLSANVRDAGAAFQAAEAALRDARRDLNSIEIMANTRRVPNIVGKTGFGNGQDKDDGSCGTTAQTLGLCRTLAKPSASPANAPPPYNTNFDQPGSVGVVYGTYTGAPRLEGVRVQPQYYIEVLCLPQYGGSLGDPNFCNFYRITGVGWGSNPNTQIKVQEIFLKM